MTRQLQLRIDEESKCQLLILCFVLIYNTDSTKEQLGFRMKHLTMNEICIYLFLFKKRKLTGALIKEIMDHTYMEM